MSSITHTKAFYEKKRIHVESKTKVCRKCKAEKDKGEFTSSKTTIDGVYPTCKKCKAEINRKSYKKNPNTFYKSIKEWVHRNPEKRKAWGKVRWAVSTGRITKPDTCQSCGNKKRLEAHHWNGYAEEHCLDVQWLCRSCHRKADTKS